jgi:hypothetical protein
VAPFTFDPQEYPDDQGIGQFIAEWVVATNSYPLATRADVAAAHGVFPDIATNVVYHVVVSNGHWLIQEVQ